MVSLYYFTEATSQDDLQTLQRVNDALNELKRNPALPAVVVPINLGYSSHGVYSGSHWTGLVIRKSAREESSAAAASEPIAAYQAFYNDSFGTSMEVSLPNLKKILRNHDIPDESITDFRLVGHHPKPEGILNLYKELTH